MLLVLRIVNSIIDVANRNRHTCFKFMSWPFRLALPCLSLLLASVCLFACLSVGLFVCLFTCGVSFLQLHLKTGMIYRCRYILVT